MNRLLIIISMAACLFMTACNSDEPGISPSQIQNALSQMKGTYSGEMRASYYHGSTISNGNVCEFRSDDSLFIEMDLTPLASTIGDEAIASRLREIGTVRVKAGYEFYQMDESMYNFVLLPADVFINGGYGAPSSVKIVFDQSFGGHAFCHDKMSIMLNLSPKELWIGGEKYEPFSQLVYHYEGTVE